METFYILFKNIRIQGANAVSSPITYGFPSVGGFVGAMHAMQRRLPENMPLQFNGVLIACRKCTPRTFREHAFSDASFIQTRNPVGKDGKPVAIIEEGKVDLSVSLVIEVHSDKENAIRNNIHHTQQQLSHLLIQQRIAGGSVMNIGTVQIFNTSGKSLDNKQDLISQLLPSYILTDASDELPEIVAELQADNPQATALDALFATAQIFQIPPENETGKWQTKSIKTGRGWLVPIPVGYQAIADEIPAGKLQNCRNLEYSARFVESVYSLGKWVFPLSCQDNWQQHFWSFRQPENHNGNTLYRYATDYASGKNDDNSTTDYF